jgi:hypothetical protein
VSATITAVVGLQKYNEAIEFVKAHSGKKSGDTESKQKPVGDPTKAALNVGRYEELMELAKERYGSVLGDEESTEEISSQPSEEGYEKAKAQVRANHVHAAGLICASFAGTAAFTDQSA